MLYVKFGRGEGASEIKIFLILSTQWGFFNKATKNSLSFLKITISIIIFNFIIVLNS